LQVRVGPENILYMMADTKTNSTPNIVFLDPDDLEKKFNAVLEFAVGDPIGGDYMGAEICWTFAIEDKYKRTMHIIWYFRGDAQEHADDYDFRVDECPKRLTKCINHLKQKAFIDVDYQYLVHEGRASVVIV